MPKCTIVYDDKGAAGLGTGWGFSCVVEGEATGARLLFDTGWDGRILLGNLEKLGFEPEDISIVFISHAHWDHIGGLAAFLGENGKVKVCVPKSSSGRFSREIGKHAELVKVGSPSQIAEGFYSTGELGTEIKEHALVTKGENGNLLVCGCSHPGLNAIVKSASQFGKICAITGGFHSEDGFDMLKGIEKIAPCHCTKNVPQIKGLYPHAFVEACGAGTVID